MINKEANDSKQSAIDEIIRLAQESGVSVADLEVALKKTPSMQEVVSSGIVARVFSYIGGILILCGIAIFISMQWDQMSLFARIFSTLGIGFCLFVMAVTTSKIEHLSRAATPLFLIAALLEAMGLDISIKEFLPGQHPIDSTIFTFAIMLLQQGLTFVALKRTTLVFTSVFSAGCLIAAVFERMDISEILYCFIVGVLVLLTGFFLRKTSHRVLTPLHELVGSVLVLWSVFDWVEGTRVELEILYLGLTLGLVFLSTLVQSRTFLAVGTVATIAYIGYFSQEYFAESLGWPVFLVFMGLILMVLGGVAVRINKRFINNLT